MRIGLIGFTPGSDWKVVDYDSTDALLDYDLVIFNGRSFKTGGGYFARKPETDEQYLERVCDWISDLFRGYSINHVSGRFKVGHIKTRREIAEAEALESNRYLVDETTAVVRFIFPCGKGLDVQEAERTADQIRWFFEKLFVDTILEVVNGENEIWLLESGMHHSLHIFEAED